MKAPLLGACIALAVALGYLIFSPRFLGIPDGPGAEVILYPGILIGVLCYEFFDASTFVCQVAGTVTMGIVGGALGTLAGWMQERFARRKGH